GGVVVIGRGLNAHSGYYGWVAQRLTSDGLAVYAIDLRGRGKSDGERFYVEKFADYLRLGFSVLITSSFQASNCRQHARLRDGRVDHNFIALMSKKISGTTVDFNASLLFSGE